MHIAALGGLWQVVVFGFAGLSLHPDGLIFEPRLPETWQSLSFSVRWRGRTISVGIDASARRLDAVLRGGAVMKLIVRGTSYDLLPGESLQVSLGS